ncbi:MAG TPA: hypothetical protein VGV41_12420 [Pseudolabrys sp.]|uniref:hypothetical protein n=1 Tax=Pseudolabrys sp. TaxID=1960880 RepID=UPI002DDD1C60|nr:hypothetical protein [Pseudolabrys sp.]HEV2629436.1 hypothetical protein [Pseudolabrys sp.]
MTALTNIESRRLNVSAWQRTRLATYKATWLRLAQEWTRLLRSSHGTETAQADQKDWPPGSGEDSGTSH